MVKAIPIFKKRRGPLREILSRSPEETMAFGEQLAAGFKGGEIVCLFGDLGSGKTVLTKGMAKGLKIPPSRVNSPTFVLMNVYEGRLSMFHFDLYRLDNPRGISSIGYDEFLYGSGVSVIEWADRLGEFLPKEFLKIELKHKNPEERIIRVSFKTGRNNKG